MSMAKFSYPLIFAILALCLTGCPSYTQVGDGRGTPSPDGRFRLAVGIAGAYGHAYVDKTKKSVWISITTTNDVTLFQRSFILTGSDVAWHTSWASADEVSVELFDWGDGVSNYNNMNHMAASNHIALFAFTLDKTSGKFIEKK